MVKKNFLLGKGERLTEEVVIRSGGGPKSHPYTFSEARNRLSPMLNTAVDTIDRLPEAACPQDKAVAALTINPEYLAKSYFPTDLLRATGLEAIGSRQKKITAEKRSRMRTPEEKITTELFVMGDRSALRRWNATFSRWVENDSASRDILSIEEIKAPSSTDKIKGQLPIEGNAVFEVVLHTDELLGERVILPAFREYLNTLDVDPDFSHRFYASGLGFLEIEAPVEIAELIAQFSALRVIRQMPQLRVLRPTLRSPTLPSQTITLPTEAPIDTEISVAIFDGGVPDNHPITQWVTPIDTLGVGAPTNELYTHGVGVTSALLFGHIKPSEELKRPYCFIDHYRVLDNEPGSNPSELYEVLERIDGVLSETEYDFVNLSLGPWLPIEDDDVHAWTAVLDDRMGKSDTLAAIAVGNDGEGDAITGLNRIQVPADCVNAMAIGACDSPENTWQRAAYSSVGPGRSPGIIKPDLVDFGGAIERPFLALSASATPMVEATGGTSFSTPTVLRTAAGVYAQFKSGLNLLAIRTLLVHRSEQSDLPKDEIGWGRIAQNIDDIILCDDDTIRIVYQGEISPAKYQRIQVPMPDIDISGNVNVSATLCYKSKTDPHHPGNYTRAGLEVAFRPHDQKFNRDGQVHPNTKTFFGKHSTGLYEDELRADAWKWENCLNDSHNYRGSSLRNPCFDIHYNSRLEGRDFRPNEALSYAIVVTVRAKNVVDLYDQVIRKYATVLEPIRPSIGIPLHTGS